MPSPPLLYCLGPSLPCSLHLPGDPIQASLMSTESHFLPPETQLQPPHPPQASESSTSFREGGAAGTGTPSPASAHTDVSCLHWQQKPLESFKTVCFKDKQEATQVRGKPAETELHPLFPGPVGTLWSLWPCQGFLKEPSSAPPWQKPSPLRALFLCCDRCCSDTFGTQILKKKTDHPSLGNYRATERPFSYSVISNRLF